MRVSALPLFLLIVGLLAADGLAGQTGKPFRLSTDAFGPGPLSVTTAATTDTSWKHRLLTGLGSAALGSGMGFFVSQVTTSDWDEVPGQTQANRSLWAALGGSVGFAVGFSFPITNRAPPRNVVANASGGRSLITLAEIRDVSVDNAYDIVRLLRPEWLRVRPPANLVGVQPQTVPVYLDDFRYGDVESMRGIHVQTISSIRFIPAATATARWGTGHVMGVIQIIASG